MHLPGRAFVLAFLALALVGAFASADEAAPPAGVEVAPPPTDVEIHPGETLSFRWVLTYTPMSGNVSVDPTVVPPPADWSVDVQSSEGLPLVLRDTDRQGVLWVNVTAPGVLSAEAVDIQVNLTFTGSTVSGPWHIHHSIHPPGAEAGEEEVFLQLTILLTVAVASHFVIKRFRQPTIIGEIAIGVILGPSILGFVLAGWQPPAAGAPSYFDEGLITIFAGLGAIFLLFLIGLETDIRAIYQKKNIYVALGGVILPWVAGFAVAYFMIPDANILTDRFAMSAFVGATLVATSTAIAAAVLLELKMIRTDVASTIMGAVIVDDILGLLVLSMALGVSAGNVDILSMLFLLGTAVAFIVVAMFIGTRYFTRLVVWTQAAGLRRGLKHAGFMVAMAVALFTAFLSEVFGLSAVIGAFLAGAMFSGTPLRRDFEEGVSFLGAVFTPIFFISLGLLVNIWALNLTLMIFGVVLLLAAFLTKFYGCSIPARMAGMSKHASAAVGYGMAPRGEVGLIIALVAQQEGVIGPDLFSIIVLVMIVVSVLPAPFLRRALIAMKSEEKAAPGEDSAASEGPVV